jgi:predicted GH43/DUF377 family glycosyl hydrolase
MKVMRAFSYVDILGGYAEGITRRDPSPVIMVNDIYYVWYSRSTVTSHGYTATIWYATSTDGWEWTEREEALGRGRSGEFDDFGVFTPSIFVHEGTFYLSYTAVSDPFYNGLSGQPTTSPTAIGLASSKSPTGPWERVPSNPVLIPREDPLLFDSLRVDDSCFVVRENRIWMYYKGRPNEKRPDETMMGLAVASDPAGPYKRVGPGAVVEGGHEVCTWPVDGGVASLHSNVGTVGNTLRWSNDGVKFDKVADIKPPTAPGPYRADHFASDVNMELTWGLCIRIHSSWPWLGRFDAIYE